MKTPTRLEPPEGGWGILVCIGMAMPFVSGLAALPSFGLVFGDFLKSIGAETSAIAFITSAFFCSLSFSGLFSGYLFTRFGLRNVGLVGGILYTVGTFYQVFVTSTFDLMIAFSLIQGIGFGLIIPASYTTFNNYFVKKRIMWMSFAQTLIGLGTMIYPVVMQKLLEWYGFRGCLGVLAAINSHAILGMLLMQPVEWHMKRVPLTEQELEEVRPKEEEEEEEEVKVEKENVPEAEPDKALPPTAEEVEDPHHLSPLMLSREGSQRRSHETLRRPQSRRGSRWRSGESLRKLSSRASSITSLGNWTGPVVVSDASPEMMHLPMSKHHSVISSLNGPIELPRTKWQMIVDFLDLTLLKSPVYVNIVLGISFALYSDIAFFTLQPLYLFELGFTKPDTASIIAIGAAADLGSRIFLAFSAVFFTVPSRYIYLAGALFTLIARFAFIYVFDFVGMACITAVMGFLRTWVHVPLPLVFAEYLPKERFATGYGLFMFLQGNITFAVGPIVGYIRDTTKNYEMSFHVLNFFMALCVVPWLIEIAWFKCCKKTESKENDVNSERIRAGTAIGH